MAVIRLADDLIKFVDGRILELTVFLGAYVGKSATWPTVVRWRAPLRQAKLL
jgi:hypothetical protein